MDSLKNKIIIDGLWNIGKTTYCRLLEKKGWKYISEPNHIIEKAISGCTLSEINIYYILAHFRNMIELEKSQLPTVLERCIFSVFAYNYAINNNISKLVWGEIQYLKLPMNLKIFFFYKNFEKFKIDITTINVNNSLIPKEVSIENFYSRFLNSWRKIAYRFPNNIKIIKLKKTEFVTDKLSTIK